MNSSDFLKIYDIALASVLEPDVNFHYRSICRWYSEHFHTPLHIVEKDLPIQYVVAHYYEAQISSADEEDLEGMIAKSLNPGWNQDEEEDIQRFIEEIEREEKIKKSGTKKVEKQSSESKPEASGALEAKVEKTYEEPPPPEADSNPDSFVDLTSVFGDHDDDSSFD